eukprot:CFRG4755T1
MQNAFTSKSFCIELGNDGRHAPHVLYRLTKGTKLIFSLSKELQSYPVRFNTNFPKDGSEFIREEFHEICFIYQSSRLERYGIGERQVELQIFLSGAFNFNFEYTDENAVSHLCEGTFIVEPELTLNDKPLRLDAVAAQTYITKCLGHVDEWEHRLKVSSECSFNFIHFTPLQQLGQSNSSYSIADQLALNPALFSKGAVGEAQVTSILTTLERSYGLLSLTDVVWNHTADNSPWLAEHPEAGYNLSIMPHLMCAYELDEGLMRFSANIVNGCAIYSETGETLSPTINNEDDLNKIMRSVELDVIPKMRLWEYYVADVENVMIEFKEKIAGLELHKRPEFIAKMNYEGRIRYLREKLTNEISQFSGRYSPIDLDVCVECLIVESYGDSKEFVTHRAVDELRHLLEEINMGRYEAFARDINTAVAAIRNSVKYMRLDGSGPKVGDLSIRFPLAYTYFTRLQKSNAGWAYNSSLGGDTTYPIVYDNIMKGVDCDYICANNGWIWGGDALHDFASPGSHVYFRREVIIWGDCVKLRYGDKPTDNPFLWDHMRKYTNWTAKHFHGLRIDNCHSTPVHVAQYLLDEARKIRPELYVMAELFTGSEGDDNCFVNALGINSLIREAMSAPDCNELGRLVHKYGGCPIGSLPKPIVENFCGEGDVMMVAPSHAHALFMDTTHDNEPPIQKRSLEDTLANAAITAMSACAIGSNRGYDEVVPHYIDVVNEVRLYASWATKEYEKLSGDNATCDGKSGIIAARRALNDLHVEMGQENFTEIYVDQVTSEVLVITRHNPDTRESVILVANSAFKKYQKHSDYIPPVKVVGQVTSVILEASMEIIARRDSIHISKTSTDRAVGRFEKDDNFINGIKGVSVYVQRDVSIDDSKCCSVEKTTDGETVHINANEFPTGAVLVLKTVLHESAQSALKRLSTFKERAKGDLHLAIADLTLFELNYVLYRCNAEEWDEEGHGTYDLPGHGPLIYAGLQGLMTVVSDVCKSDSGLGHALCDNLRAGDWLMTWAVDRLKKKIFSAPLGKWLDTQFKDVQTLPRFLIPTYFADIWMFTYEVCYSESIKRMSPFVQDGDSFVRKLAMTSIQLMTNLKSAPCRDESLIPSQPSIHGTSGVEGMSVSMAAGLPHFSHGMMRAWGRDTFIALRGLLLVTGRFEDAAKLIIGFAGTARHGLIPNLLDASRNPRFNCRDAVWFWLQAIQDYCEIVPKGEAILDMPVARLYPSDTRDDYQQSAMAKYQFKGDAVVQPLRQVMLECLQKHVDGISFREWGAGEHLDRNMLSVGFHIDIYVDRDSGIVYGGSEFNCGTWMDKMGESHKAKSVGVPGTPRDGADIEIVGLCKSTVRWLSEMHSRDKFCAGVKEFTFAEWDFKLKRSFEKYFFVPIDSGKDSYYHIDSSIVNRRGIYKDTVGSTKQFTDYQFRPNLCIAMAVAPEMFDPEHAKTCLQMVEKVLLGPLGMATLDPLDWNYRGVYDNANDSDDFHIAKGLNYHQGPEWVWPVGYFLRAKLNFLTATKEEKMQCYRKIGAITTQHHKHISSSVWRGIHELTNSHGQNCNDSSPTQAWSMSCLLDAFWDAEQLVHHTST